MMRLTLDLPVCCNQQSEHKASYQKFEGKSDQLSPHILIIKNPKVAVASSALRLYSVFCTTCDSWEDA